MTTKESDIDTTLIERGKEYGKFTDHASITQHLKDVMRTETTSNWFTALDEDQREALEMIVHKIGRILNGNPNNHDSWHDIAGYAKLVADRLLGVVK
jgi:predicted P-loop ATPase/GTPase